MKNRMKEKGKTLSEESADYLVEVVGDHLYDLDNALEKVFLSVGEKGTIELSDLEEITSEVKVSTVFDLTDAIGHQNLEKALGILGKAMESKAIVFRKEEQGSKFGRSCPSSLEHDGKAILEYVDDQRDDFSSPGCGGISQRTGNVTVEYKEIDGSREDISLRLHSGKEF